MEMENDENGTNRAYNKICIFPSKIKSFTIYLYFNKYTSLMCQYVYIEVCKKYKAYSLQLNTGRLTYFHIKIYLLLLLI